MSSSAYGVTSVKKRIKTIEQKLTEIEQRLTELEEEVNSGNANKDEISQVIYEGSFDVTQDGDIIIQRPCPSCSPEEQELWHWKEIIIPEIDLDNMPDVKIYVKPYPLTEMLWFYPNNGDVWGDTYAVPWSSSLPTFAVFDQGKVLLHYKRCYVGEGCYDEPTFSGDYKVVVTYTKKKL